MWGILIVGGALFNFSLIKPNSQRGKSEEKKHFKIQQVSSFSLVLS